MKQETRPILYAKNFDVDHIITPVNAERLEEMLVATGYDEQKTRYLVEGFRNGFDFGYTGPTDRADTSTNIPFSVGDKIEL